MKERDMVALEILKHQKSLLCCDEDTQTERILESFRVADMFLSLSDLDESIDEWNFACFLMWLVYITNIRNNFKGEKYVIYKKRIRIFRRVSKLCKH